MCKLYFALANKNNVDGYLKCYQKSERSVQYFIEKEKSRVPWTGNLEGCKPGKKKTKAHFPSNETGNVVCFNPNRPPSLGCTAVGRTRHLSKEPYLPHAVLQNSSMARASVDPGRGLDAVQIDDPELTREGQPSVPETLLLLRQKVECLSKPIQALRDLADILE